MSDALLDPNPRCLCGHYRSEYTPACTGAYGTLTTEAYEESVEVNCLCDRFFLVEPGYHQVRG